MTSELSWSDRPHAAIPGAQLVVLPDVGHVSNVQAPLEFNTEVRRFLMSVP